MIKRNIYILVLAALVILFGIYHLEKRMLTSYCYICANQNYSIYYDDDKLFVGCAGSAATLDLRVVDPVSLDTLKTFPVEGLIEKVISVDNGESLLVLLAEVDGLESTHDGMLIKMDYETGIITHSVDFPINMPMAMVTDSNQMFVYVTIGLMYEYDEHPPMLYKFSVNDLKVQASTVIGEGTYSIALTNDGTKLYTIGEGVQLRYDDIEDENISVEYYYEIPVYSSDLELINNIESDFPFGILAMGYDNRLFVGDPHPNTIDEYGLHVIDTTTDQFIEHISFGMTGNEGIIFIEFNPYTNHLYATINEYGYWDDVLEDYVHEPSSRILKLDLNDYTHEFIETGVPNLWQLAVMPEPTGTRIFCTTEKFARRIVYFDD